MAGLGLRANRTDCVESELGYVQGARQADARVGPGDQNCPFTACAHETRIYFSWAEVKNVAESKAPVTDTASSYGVLAQAMRTGESSHRVPDQDDLLHSARPRSRVSPING